MTVRSDHSSLPDSGAPPANGPIPLELLAREVYDEATPPLQRRMLALLVGKVFETAPNDLRGALVAALIRPLGVLSLVAVADGKFANIFLRGGLSDPWVMADGLKNLVSRDVVDLAAHAQQVKLQVLDGLTPILSALPSLYRSPAGNLLLEILEHRAPGHGLN